MSALVVSEVEPTEQALERTMLWMFVQLVAETVPCTCGTPPNDNGSPCASCLASQMLADVAQLPQPATITQPVTRPEFHVDYAEG